MRKLFIFFTLRIRFRLSISRWSHAVHHRISPFEDLNENIKLFAHVQFNWNEVKKKKFKTYQLIRNDEYDTLKWSETWSIPFSGKLQFFFNADNGMHSQLNEQETTASINTFVSMLYFFFMFCVQFQFVYAFTCNIGLVEMNLIITHICEQRAIDLKVAKRNVHDSCWIDTHANMVIIRFALTLILFSSHFCCCFWCLADMVLSLQEINSVQCVLFCILHTHYILKQYVLIHNNNKMNIRWNVINIYIDV